MRFIDVEIEPSPAFEDGLSMRFKRTDEDTARAITWVDYESESGLDGRWRVASAHGHESAPTPGATAAQVEDSSDGVVWLVTGGRHGLVLTHESGSASERAPYLLLSLRTRMG